MVQEIVQINYDTVERIAKDFSQCGYTIDSVSHSLKSAYQELVDGGFQGTAADRFFTEMETDVFSSIQRLENALYQTETTLNTVIDILTEAEERAAEHMDGAGAGIYMQNGYRGDGGGSQNVPYGPGVDGGLYDLNGKAYSGEPDVVFINGILTGFDGFKGGMQLVDGKWSGNVAGIYNGTDGFGDIPQALQDKFVAGYAATYKTGQNPAVDSIIKLVMNDSDGKLELVAHSQGAASTAVALQVLARNGVNLDGITVTTFGGFGTDFPEGPTYHHYFHKGDPVPMLGAVTDFGINPANSMRMAQNTTIIDDGTWLPGDDHNFERYVGNLDRFRADEARNHGLGGTLNEMVEVHHAWSDPTLLPKFMVGYGIDWLQGNL